MPTYNNALTDQPANRLAFPSSIGPVPRNEYLGALADFLAKSYSPERTQQMQGISQLLGMPAVSRTLDMMSYGDPLTTGAGGLGGTTRVKPDVLEAALTVAPLGKPATMATLQAARLARQAAMAGGRAGERYAERVVPQIMERGGLGAEMLGAMSNRTISPLDVYHGSPHRLPPTERNPLGEFDASKIGTGEGAQVYGHGIYTAEARPVAEEYAKNLANADKMNQGRLTAHANAQRLTELAGSPQYAADDIRFVLESNPDHEQKKLLTETLNFLESGDYKKPLENKGNLYKVDLPDEMIPKMLDYDKHLSEQSPEVQKILLPYQKEIGSSFGTGEQTLKAIAFERRMKGLDDSPAAVAEQLRQMGIPGVKYLDQQSRNAGGWHLTSPDNTVRGKWMLKSSDYNSNGVFFDSKKEAEAALKEKLGKETRNFVTFPGEEKNLTILERNGQKAVPTARQDITDYSLTPQGQYQVTQPTPAMQTWGGFSSEADYAAYQQAQKNQAERMKSAWADVQQQDLSKALPFETGPVSQRDIDYDRLYKAFPGTLVTPSTARTMLEKNMLKASKQEKDLLRKYIDEKGKWIPNTNSSEITNNLTRK
jgi:hypothetical protein